MDPSVEKYLNDLRIQREEVEKRLKDREYKKRESDEIFVSSVKKELEWLEKNKIKYELRNKKFLEEAKDIVEGYKAELAKAYQADQALNASRRKLNKFIQKNYPKIVSELKTRLFRDHDEVSKKLKSVRDGGNDMLRLNKEIRDLSEEIQAKRYELLEEEERRLRNEGSLRHYQYASNPATRPYDAPTGYGKRLSPRNEPDVSRSKVDITVSPPRGPGVLNNQSHSHISGDGNRASTLSKASNLKPSPDKDKLHPGKGVSFGGISEAPHSRETEHQVRSSYGDGKGMSSLNIQQQHQHQHQHQPQPVAKKSPRKLEEEFDARDLGRGKDTGLGGFGTGKQGGGLSGFGGSQSQAPNAMGGLKVPGKGETSPSPVKSGFGQPGGGMQKLNLSNIGAPKQQQQAAVTKPVYNQQDMEDLEEFEDF